MRKDESATVMPSLSSLAFAHTPLVQGVTLHYLTDGSCMLQFSKNKELFYVPVVLVMKVWLCACDRKSSVM